LVWIAFVIVLVTAFGYVLIIRAQESYPPEAFVVPFVAAYLALMAVMLGASLRPGRLAVRLRPALRGGAAAGLLAIGVLALTSIGILLVVAGGLAAAAAVMTLVGRHWSTFPAEAAGTGWSRVDITTHVWTGISTSAQASARAAEEASTRPGTRSRRTAASESPRLRPQAGNKWLALAGNHP
jgi:hypothetical protein